MFTDKELEMIHLGLAIGTLDVLEIRAGVEALASWGREKEKEVRANNEKAFKALKKLLEFEDSLKEKVQ